MKVYFEASSVLASYNLDLPKAMSSDIDTYVDIEHPLLYAIYLYERFHGRYGGFKVIPPYIDMFTRFHVIKKTDVAHLNSLNANLAKWAKKLGKPVVVVLHAAPFSKEAYDAINDYVDVYIAPSNFTKIHEEPKMGSKKVVVIYHGIDTELFNAGIPPGNARRKLGIPLNVKVILWNDRISPEKDLRTFLQAAEIILKEVKEAYIYIKGRAIIKSYYKHLKSDLERLQRSGRVKLHIDWIPHSKLPLLYRAADIFVRTSNYESFGLGAVEAMACGIPVIAPNATTFPEVIGYEKLLYKPGDFNDLARKIINLITDADFYNSVKEYLLTRTREYFNIRNVARKYIETYFALVQSDDSSIEM
jgi:glycosyltransferase involved in cell wall biosynthesis